MKTQLKTLTFIVSFFFFLSLSAQTDWVTIKIEGEGYRVDFPSQPKKQTNTIPSQIGDLEMKFYILDNSFNPNDDNLVYMSAFTAYPEEYMSNEDPGFKDTVLDGAVNGAVTNVNGKLLSKENIFFNGFPGRTAKIEIQGSTIINQKIVLVDNLLYICQIICMADKDDNKSMKAFFDSFDLIKVKK
ncbi:hypothetical protein GWK08_09920 [Leptobacterium flavescens]|uniref:YceI family protein n=1 Tax=Leptobacterium flavescens TaxID=472055 RepID=A0A6P0UTK6_9FLAO|nr:hypothetical protein [Leptobacterium flavescens]NER13756.1 hypothetical protein [Leptobacterium flavescens]